MKTVLRSLLGCALFLLSVPALAQSSTLVGSVTRDDTKKPVEGVLVTATSPSLQGEHTAITDEGGNYRIPQLPTGIYTLRFEKEGVPAFTRSDINLRPNRAIRVNVVAMPGASGDALVFALPQPSMGCFGSSHPHPALNAEFFNGSWSELRSASGSREAAPDWALPRMPILIPDGTPQLVYTAPRFSFSSHARQGGSQQQAR